MQSIIQITLYALTIFIPLIFTTINSELFEFPKFILLLSGTIIISVAWIIDILVYNHKPIFKLKGIALGMLLVLITQTLATIFSIHPYTSFWGYYSRFHQGLLTTICYTIIYFAATKYIDTKSTQSIIKISIYTAFIISLYAILERFGIDKKLWVQDVVNRPFSTLGQPNWLAAYLLPHLFLSLYLVNKKSNLTHYAVLVTITIALLLTKSRSGLLALALSYPTYYYLLSRQLSLRSIIPSMIRQTLYLILSIIIAGTALTPSIFALYKKETTPTPTVITGTQLESGGTESGDIRKIVWTGALELIKQHPLLGTGPETFAYSYYWVRPLSHNYVSEWDFLYNKAHNEYLNYAATSGLIGLFAYLYLHFVIFRSSLTIIPKSKKVNQTKDNNLRSLYPVLGATIISFAVTNFFGFSVIPVYLLMVLIAAMPTTLSNTSLTNTSPSSYSSYFVILLIPLIYPARLFLADYNYNLGKSALDSGNPQSAIPYLQNATSIRPSLALYHSALAESYGLIGESEPAVKEAETTLNLNPYHLNYYKSRAKTYLALASSDPSYYNQAAKEIMDARSLAPTDPKLAYNLGLIYTRLANNDQAIEELKQAISLKKDYESPYYALTLLYEQTGHKDLVPSLLKDAKTNLATYSANLREKINSYN